jgi:type I restriction enzyme S subunit
LIERLKEKRAALISRTVIRGLPPDAARAAGLDPHPKLKPSGIEWLGNVPEHWGTVAIRRRVRRLQTGSTPPTVEERYYEDGTVPWYGPGSFDNQIVLSNPVKMLHESAVREGAARLFAAGTTFVVTIGATLGKVSSLGQGGSCNQQITAIEFDPRGVYARFATYQIKRLEGTLRAVAPSATLPILDQGEIGDVVLALPEVDEQRVIANFLDRETAKLDAMVTKIEIAIERLQEYRTALITAAVTGKIDVRGQTRDNRRQPASIS